ncbi:MAG: RelA/SpoT domain-containing protein [Dehalococcoidia bacterium]
MALTKAAIDRLGDRLRSEELAPDDVDAYHALRSTMLEELAAVHLTVTNLGVELLRAGTRLKTLESTRAKLRRSTTKLSQMQDLAGCRATVLDLDAQDRLTERIVDHFQVVRHYDLRDRPRCGYRAIHVVVRTPAGPVELQLRTRFQDSWANHSERLSERFGLEVKYCGGPPWVRRYLDWLAETGRQGEDLERMAARISGSGAAGAEGKSLHELAMSIVNAFSQVPLEWEE